MRATVVLGVLAIASTAFGFIERLYPLKEVMDASSNILVGRIESVDAQKKTAVASIDRAAKGPQEFRRVLMNLGVGTGDHVRYLLERLKAGQPVIIFYQREGNNLASCVHSGNTWFQLFASEEGERDKLWWRMSHVEVYLGRTFNGTTPDLVRMVDEVLAGRMQAPAPDPTVPKLDPSAPPARTAPAPTPPPSATPAAVPAPLPDGLESLDGWIVETGWGRPGTLSRPEKSPGRRAMEVACDGPADRKLALTLLHHVDLSSARQVVLDFAGTVRAPVRVSVAFGAAPDWQMYECPPATVEAPGGQTVTFRLDRPHFKCEASGWQHTRPLPNSGRIDKVMIIVDGLPAKATLRLDGMRFAAGGFRRAAEYPHKGGEVRGFAWGDVDGDERPDALVCVGSGNLLLVNQGNGFREQSADFGLAGGSRSASWADYDGDGHMDLLTHDYRLYTGAGGRLRDDSARLAAPKERNPEGVGWIDYNGDGRPDILITDGVQGVRLYENTGVGPAWFRDVSDRAGLGLKGLGAGNGDFVVFADFNADGFTDFLYNLDKGLLAANAGGGGFRIDPPRGGAVELGGPGAKRGLAVADMDLDGDVDVFVPGPERPRLYRNNNDGTFTDALDAAGDLARVDAASFSAAWGDVNGDGKPDLFVCLPASESRLYLGDGRGAFTDATASMGLAGIAGCFAASFVDVDGDGDVDLLVNLTDRAALFLNETPPAEGFAMLAVDVRARRGLAGAIVRLTDEKDRPLGLRELVGAEGCGGQGEPTAHFAARVGARATVSVCLSDGRQARKEAVIDARANRLRVEETDFK